MFLGMGAVAMFGYVTGVVMTYFRGSLSAPAALSISRCAGHRSGRGHRAPYARDPPG